jgi:hypothetical protein
VAIKYQETPYKVLFLFEDKCAASYLLRQPLSNTKSGYR